MRLVVNATSPEPRKANWTSTKSMPNVWAKRSAVPAGPPPSAGLLGERTCSQKAAHPHAESDVWVVIDTERCRSVDEETRMHHWRGPFQGCSSEEVIPFILQWWRSFDSGRALSVRESHDGGNESCSRCASSIELVVAVEGVNLECVFPDQRQSNLAEVERG